MNAAFQNWFYGEDGMNPVSRIRVLHKVSIVLLALAAYFRFFELKFDSLGMQLYSTSAFFTLGFGVVLIVLAALNLVGPQWSFLIYFSRRGGNWIVTFFLALFLAAMVGWLVTPLYLLLFAADLSYTIRLKRKNPQLLKKEAPSHKDLTRRQEED